MRDGSHTEFAHLARGFPGNDRELAERVGEALLEAELLVEKPSVGQRHVYLNSAAGGGHLRARGARRSSTDGSLAEIGVSAPSARSFSRCGELQAGIAEADAARAASRAGDGPAYVGTDARRRHTPPPRPPRRPGG